MHYSMLLRNELRRRLNDTYKPTNHADLGATDFGVDSKPAPAHRSSDPKLSCNRALRRHRADDRRCQP